LGFHRQRQPFYAVLAVLAACRSARSVSEGDCLSRIREPRYRRASVAFCRGLDLSLSGGIKMATSSLMLHCGAREVSREELAVLPCPPPTKTWAPVNHARVLDTALGTLREAGYSIEKACFGLSGGDDRFFGTLDLSTPLTPDGTVTLAVGIRNSVDKTYVECDVMLD
jgi:hypothetical protein